MINLNNNNSSETRGRFKGGRKCSGELWRWYSALRQLKQLNPDWNETFYISIFVDMFLLSLDIFLINYLQLQNEYGGKTCISKSSICDVPTWWTRFGCSHHRLRVYFELHLSNVNHRNLLIYVFLIKKKIYSSKFPRLS